MSSACFPSSIAESSCSVNGDADEMESASNVSPQLSLFQDEAPPVRGRSHRRGRQGVPALAQITCSATTLYRVHAAMLFQASGRA